MYRFGGRATNKQVDMLGIRTYRLALPMGNRTSYAELDPADPPCKAASVCSRLLYYFLIGLFSTISFYRSTGDTALWPMLSVTY